MVVFPEAIDVVEQNVLTVSCSTSLLIVVQSGSVVNNVLFTVQKTWPSQLPVHFLNCFKAIAFPSLGRSM